MKRFLPIVTILLAISTAILAWQTSARRGRAPRQETDERRGQAPRALDHRPEDPGEVTMALDEVLPETDEAGPRQRHWLVEFFTPKPGETMSEYRDRVLPVVQAAAAPQRTRVVHWRADFERDAELDDAQRRELDAAVAEAGDALKDRIMQGVLSGELTPPDVKPSTAVAFARDLLDLADGANRRFRASLRPEQAEIYDHSPFDVSDYLFFHTRWEDLLLVEEKPH